jgi:hypothetical protein
MNIDKMLRRVGILPARRRGVSVGDVRTCDAPTNIFQYRMNTGFAGDPTRTHPTSIFPQLIDPNAPPTYFGQGVIADISSTNGVRVPNSGDSGLTLIWGITVRPFPFQQATTATNYGGNTFGGEAPASSGAIDILRSGSIMVTLQGSTAAQMGAAAKMCIVAGTGYVVGGFSMDSVSGTFITLTDAYFNGPAGADGLVELVFNI